MKEIRRDHLAVPEDSVFQHDSLRNSARPGRNISAAVYLPLITVLVNKT